MNLKPLWWAFKFTVAVCGTLFTVGLIAQNPGLTDTAFNPIVGIVSFLGGIAFYSWRNSKSKPSE
jgi:hypothetical protein